MQNFEETEKTDLRNCEYYIPRLPPKNILLSEGKKNSCMPKDNVAPALKKKLKTLTPTPPVQTNFNNTPTPPLKENNNPKNN